MGGAVKKLQVGSVAITLIDEIAEYRDKPNNDADVQIGQARLAKLETPDGFIGTMAVISWPDGSVDVRLVDFAQGATAYERLKTAGTMNLKVLNGHWLVRVRAMKFNGKDWQTLNRVSWTELDWLTDDDAKALLTKHGAVKLGLYGDLYPEAGKAQQADLGMLVNADSVEPIAALYAITRALAVMKHFGAAAGAAVVE